MMMSIQRLDFPVLAHSAMLDQDQTLSKQSLKKREAANSHTFLHSIPRDTNPTDATSFVITNPRIEPPINMLAIQCLRSQNLPSNRITQSHE